MLEQIQPGSHAARRDLPFLETLVELSPDAAVAVDDDGQIMVANQLAGELFGYEISDLKAASLELLVPERFREAHRAHRRSYGASSRVRRMGVGIELRGRRSDGSEFPVDISLAPVVIDTGLMVIATIRDLTVRRREQAAEAHLAAIVESTADAIAATDTDGLITSWNPGAERLLGYRACEVIGQPIFIVVADEFRASLARSRARVLAGESVEPFESRRRRKDGTAVDVEVTLSAIYDRAGQLLGVSGVFRDITERRRAEAEHARAQREHEELLMVAERERIARDLHDLVIQRVFAAGLSLEALVGLADEHVASRLNRVIYELDEVIAEIRTTIFALHDDRQARVSVRRLVLDLVADAGTALGHDPVVRFAGAVDEAVRGEIEEHVVAVIREAISNVARHAHASATTLDLTVEGDQLVLVVADNGVGMGATTRSSGLGNLRARAESFGGSFQVGPGNRGGTRLEWRVPLTTSSEPAGTVTYPPTGARSE